MSPPNNVRYLSAPQEAACSRFIVIAAGSLTSAVDLSPVPGQTHTATQTEPTGCFSTGCQTLELELRDACTQTDDYTSLCIPALGEGLDSLGQFLQQEQSLAKVRAHKRLLLFRLLREFRASHDLAIHVSRPSQLASRASQTDLPCHPSQDALQHELGAAEDWSPFVGACKEPFACSPPLARAQSFPAPNSYHGETLTQQLQPAASAPHPIDDLIGRPAAGNAAVGVVPSLLQEAYASAPEIDGSPTSTHESPEVRVCLRLRTPCTDALMT